MNNALNALSPQTPTSGASSGVKRPVPASDSPRKIVKQRIEEGEMLADALRLEMDALKARLEKSEAEKDGLRQEAKISQERTAAAHAIIERMKTEHAEELARIQRLTSTTGEAVLSLERLRRDPLYAKKVHILTGFSSVEFLDALFDWVMAYTKDVLPRYYTSRYLREGADDDEKEDACKTVDGKTLSRTPLDMHKNYMFFTLYVIRTGPSSMERAALLFGFRTHQHAMGWYVAWLRLLKVVTARHFPQPTREIILASSPKKMLEKYNSNLMGVIDCTEQKMQTPYDKLAQRATWSEYKSNNTNKFLVVISPAGFTVYVSPAFPGRITDVQICHSCAYYHDDNAEILQENEETDEEFDIDAE